MSVNNKQVNCNMNSICVYKILHLSCVLHFMYECVNTECYWNFNVSDLSYLGKLGIYTNGRFISFTYMYMKLRC